MSVRLVLHVQPRARVSSVAGWHGDAIKIRIAAPPVDGVANAALVRFLAERLQLPVASIAVISGASARRKVVEIEGLAQPEVFRRLGIG